MGDRMSTQYRPLSPLFISDLIDGRMRKIRVNRDGSFWKRITDGQNFLSVDFDKDGRITSFTRNAGNDAQDILREIAETFDVEIVSEHEPKFWGSKHNQSGMPRG